MFKKNMLNPSMNCIHSIDNNNVEEHWDLQSFLLYPAFSLMLIRMKKTLFTGIHIVCLY